MARQSIHEADTAIFEKYMKRWNRFLNIPNEAEPVVGETPKEMVWRKNKSSLWYYPAQPEKRYNIPIFLVYSLFNQPFILDLAPGSSLIEGLVKRGYDVYLLDWGSPQLEDKDISLGDYVVDYLQKAVRRALRHSGAKEISIIGYCLGGTLSLIYAAIADEPIKNLIVSTVPVDFSQTVLPDKWMESVREGNFSLDRLIDIYGNIPAQYVEWMFKSITTPISFTPYVQLFDGAWNDMFVDRWRKLNKWLYGHVPFAGEAFRQLTYDLMKDNKLVKGEFIVRGNRVDLANIKANFYVISSSKDHLVKEEQSLPVMDLVSSVDKTYQLVEAGHISLVLTSKFPKLLDNWLKERSEPIRELAARH